MHRHECNTHIIILFRKSNKGFSYTIFPVKKNECWKNFKLKLEISGCDSTAPTGDEGPHRETISALFRHCCSTVAGRGFTILTLVHQPSLDCKRGGLNCKTEEKLRHKKQLIEHIGINNHDTVIEPDSTHKPSIRSSSPH
jgi:hypothetical protein